MIVAFVIVALLCATVCIFLNTKRFGRLPRGERKLRIKASPNYSRGCFRNKPSAIQTVEEASNIVKLSKLFFEAKRDLRPLQPIETIRTNLHNLPRDKDCVVWFGHSSYLFQIDGLRFLVDPVLVQASPLGCFNRPFEMTYAYRPDDIPPVDYLITTHDHWDHLDYQTIIALNQRVGRFVCPLGVGEHLERWNIANERIIEMDWQERYTSQDVEIHCLQSRHFSGRGLRQNQTLWASFVIRTRHRCVYVAGDGGYDERFAAIGRAYPNIDLAFIENGQYHPAWHQIHILAQQLQNAVSELNARHVICVHHSKYALSYHPWYEPAENIRRVKEVGLPIVDLRIGEVWQLP